MPTLQSESASANRKELGHRDAPRSLHAALALFVALLDRSVKFHAKLRFRRRVTRGDQAGPARVEHKVLIPDDYA
jgi:hypothetical protein